MIKICLVYKTGEKLEILKSEKYANEVLNLWLKNHSMNIRFPDLD